MDELSDIIIKHEGLRLKPYKDTVGKLTIGVGRNLDDCGITSDEALLLLHNDLIRCTSELIKYSWYLNIDNEVRRGVLIELGFNVGMVKFLEFKKMISAISVFDYDLASKELLNSLWASQVGTGRSKNMADRLSTGEYK